MEEHTVLLEIKSLDKMIVRKIIVDSGEGKVFSCSTPTPTQMEIIDYILKHEKDKVYQKDLEKVLNLRRATVSGVLQTMEKNNLIQRKVDDNDTRTKQILLNEVTKELFVAHKKKMEEVRKIVTKDISKEELKQFMKTISKMKENLRESLNKGEKI